MNVMPDQPDILRSAYAGSPPIQRDLAEEVAEFIADPHRWITILHHRLAAEAPPAKSEDRADGRPRRVKDGVTETPCARCLRWTRLDADRCDGCGGAMDWAKGTP